MRSWWPHLRMGSEEEVVESISGDLLEVKSTVAGVSSSTTPELRQ